MRLDLAVVERTAGHPRAQIKALLPPQQIPAPGGTASRHLQSPQHALQALASVHQDPRRALVPLPLSRNLIQ